MYVPRPHTELVARRAAQLLPPTGTAVDVCTGCGAVAAVLLRHGARLVVASDIEPRAVACARRNGVNAYLGDLFTPVPQALRGATDLVVAVVPYVPTAALGYLQRDTFSFESERSYHGGEGGTDVLRRVIAEAPEWLRSGGFLLLEVGGEQHALLADAFEQAGFREVRSIADDDGDIRGVEAQLLGPPRSDAS